MTAIWAHRGASLAAPENTLPAFALALALGADGLELDVHRARDGHLVVIHDETIRRTTNGRGRVVDHTLDELTTYDASGGRAGYAETRIPLLGDVLDLVATSHVTLNIELKTDRIAYPGLGMEVVGQVRAAGISDRVIVSSFNPATLADLANSGIATGLLYTRLREPWRVATELGCSALHPPARVATRRLITRCHDVGLAVNVWTVDDPGRVKELAERGVDAIITNDPAGARAALRRAAVVNHAVDGAEVLN